MALFASLGGTGYAATRLTSATDAKAKSKHKAPAKPLSAAQVNTLIGKYLVAHHIGPGKEGPTGKEGLVGKEGKTGPQGPPAQALQSGVVFEGQSSKFTVGPWTLTLECKSGPAATLKFAGPGSAYMTVGTGVANNEAKYFNDNGNVEGGNFTVTAGGQQSFEGVLVSGSTVEQLSLQTTAVKGMLSFCSLNGAGVPAS